MVISPFASRPVSEVETLPLSWPRATSTRTRSSWLAVMVPRVRWSSATSQARIRRWRRDRRSGATGVSCCVLGEPALAPDVVQVPGAALRGEGRQRELRFTRPLATGALIRLGQYHRRVVRQTGIIVDHFVDRLPGLLETLQPAVTAMRRLIVPFQQVHEQPLQLTA